MSKNCSCRQKKQRMYLTKSDARMLIVCGNSLKVSRGGVPSLQKIALNLELRDWKRKSHP